MKSEHCSFSSLVSPFHSKRPIDWNREFRRRAPIDVEIGFGMGETLLRMAQESPERNYIGIEQHWERMCKTLRAMTREQTKDPRAFENIRILRTDARVVFERLIPSRIIDTIYCLFPCPWPKKGHIKHRLFNNAFLRLLNSRLKKGGKIEIVTDFYPYYEWILDEVRGTGFQVEKSTIQPQYNTKFERKWQDEGQEEFFKADLVKQKHIRVSLKKDIVLKTYTLDQFDIKRFRLEDEKGKISVIFKETIFDETKQKAMVYSIVAEEHLTQHFWIMIAKKGRKWHIARAEGQNFFPTPGIARAIELVYEAARKSC